MMLKLKEPEGRNVNKNLLKSQAVTTVCDFLNYSLYTKNNSLGLLRTDQSVQ